MKITNKIRQKELKKKKNLKKSKKNKKIKDKLSL
jgi:hypothetical protein